VPGSPGGPGSCPQAQCGSRLGGACDRGGERSSLTPPPRRRGNPAFPCVRSPKVVEPGREVDRRGLLDEASVVVGDPVAWERAGASQLVAR
jgi:hypothetical protein